MRVSATEFEEYLAPGESVVTGSPGSLYVDAYRQDGTIGVTDRRVLFVSDDGGFLDVAHDAINSIRSRPRSTVTYLGIGHVLVALLGVLLAAFAFAGVLLLESSVVGALLGVLSVGGIAAAEYVRRHGVRNELVPFEATGRRFSAALDRSGHRDRLDGVVEDLLGGTLAEAEPDGYDELLVVGVASVALVASIGLVALAESLFVVPLVLATLGGGALAEYAYRRLRARDDVGRNRRLEREVSIRLVDGSIVHLVVGQDGRLDRDLSSLARESRRPEAAAEPTRP